MKGVKLPPFLVLIIKQDLKRIVIDPQIFLETALKKLGRETGRIQAGEYIQAVQPEPQPGFANPFETMAETRATQTRPAVDEVLIPGRDAMIMRNIMRASMPEVEPTIATPLPATQRPGENVTAAINQPTENTNPRVGETRLIQDPKGQGYVLQYFTGDKNLGWQSKQALENYIMRTTNLGTTSQPIQTREVKEERPTQAAKEQLEGPTAPKQTPFGTRAILNKKDVFYVNPEVGYVPKERFKEYAAGQQFRKDVGKVGQFLKSAVGNIISGVGQMGG